MIHWLLCMANTTMKKDSDSDVKEDQRSSSEFLVDLDAEFHERAPLANQRRFYKRSERDEESVSSMGIADEELLARKADASDERRHVLDYTDIDLHYVEDQRKNLLSKFNSLKQEFSSCKYELTDLKNTKALNSSFQNDITKLSLANESLKDEISDLKKFIEKWTSSRVTLDQILTEQSDVSTSETSPEIPSDSKFEGNTQRTLPSLLKLKGAEPSGITKCLTIPNTKQTTDKMVPVNIKQKTETKSSPDSSIEKLLFSLMQEVKGLKDQIKTHSETLLPSSQSGSSRSAKGKNKIWFGPCRHCGFKNHLTKDCYMKPKCYACGSIDHLTKEHNEQNMFKRTLAKLNTQPSQGSSRKVPMTPKPYIPRKYCGFYTLMSVSTTLGVTFMVALPMKPLTVSKRHTKGNQGLLFSDLLNPLQSGFTKETNQYSKESGLKVIFRDNSSGDTEGYGSVNCNGITFTRVTYVN
ncbi:hypothetical protein Tco_1039136, partial [Tanacetum coccineum]